MKTSLAGIAGLACWFILNLSHWVGAQVLEESCRTANQSENYLKGTWTVALRNTTDFLCAGSLIHRRFVLTAAQCIDGQSSIIAMLGANDIALPTAQLPAIRAIKHLSYSRETGQNDIGLVMLSQGVTYSDRIRPICILLDAANPIRVEALSNFQTFGWGIGTNRPRSNTLREIRIDRHNRSHCGVGLGPTSFCAGPAMGGECGGDIGGPVSKQYTIGFKLYPVQLGIVSFGEEKCYGLRTYIDVTRYTDWIERTVRSYDTQANDVNVPQVSPNPRSPHHEQVEHIEKEEPIPEVKRPEEPEETWLYRDCGEVYLMANIFGPDFMAKGVMITHRFVLTAAKKLPDNFSSLRVSVVGVEKRYQEIAIASIYKHPEDYKNDIALLKLSRELIREDKMKPICMLRRANLEESRPVLTILDLDRIDNRVRANFVRVTPLEQLKCSATLRKSIEPTQICVQNPAGIKQVFEFRGNALAKKTVLPGSNDETYALFGILSYSFNGIHVITDVTSQTDWIVSVVSENSRY